MTAPSPPSAEDRPDPAAEHGDDGAAGRVATASAVVVTYERPDFLARCLDHLRDQTRPPVEIVVVDSSLGTASRELVADRYPDVRYVTGPRGHGATATARNQGYRLTSGDVVAFVDDDAFAEPQWLERLLPHYDDPTVGAVGGRQIRDQPGELTEGLDAIGRLLPDGTLTGNFAADPGRVVEVDHLLGANMSFRRSVIDELGGIRDGYAGTCMREETDLCLRVGQAGYRLLFVPDAVVEHVAAPYAKGQRFDLRYAYWAQKNHLILLMRNYGPEDGRVRGYLRASLRELARESGERARRSWSRARSGDGRGAAAALGGAVARDAVVVAGTATGLVSGRRTWASERGR
jgi:GT2 family glycosyltransferase